jgi:hypothetical protein
MCEARRIEKIEGQGKLAGAGGFAEEATEVPSFFRE